MLTNKNRKKITILLHLGRLCHTDTQKTKLKQYLSGRMNKENILSMKTVHIQAVPGENKSN